MTAAAIRSKLDAMEAVDRAGAPAAWRDCGCDKMVAALRIAVDALENLMRERCELCRNDVPYTGLAHAIKGKSHNIEICTAALEHAALARIADMLGGGQRHEGGS